MENSLEGNMGPDARTGDRGGRSQALNRLKTAVMPSQGRLHDVSSEVLWEPLADSLKRKNSRGVDRGEGDITGPTGPEAQRRLRASACGRSSLATNQGPCCMDYTCLFEMVTAS